MHAPSRRLFAATDLSSPKGLSVRNKFQLAVALCCVAFASRALAVISYSTAGLTYQQDFNSLANAGTNPAAWTNDSTINGWNLFRVTSAADPTPTAVTTYLYSTGTGTVGSFYSYGDLNSSDRALGGLVSTGNAFYTATPNSGSVAGWIASNIANTTGHALSSFTLLFDGEQWRNGGNSAAQSMIFEYGFGSAFATVSTWFSPGGNFDWASPSTGSIASAVIGNTTGLAANRGGTVTNLSWDNNTTLWLRWVENNDPNNDHGLAIDSIRFSATSVVPEASVALFGALISAALILHHRSRILRAT